MLSLREIDHAIYIKYIIIMIDSLFMFSVLYTIRLYVPRYRRVFVPYRNMHNDMNCFVSRSCFEEWKSEYMRVLASIGDISIEKIQSGFAALSLKNSNPYFGQ